MSSRPYILARLSCTRDDLNEVIARLSDEDLRWAPAAGMHTAGDLLLEIARKDMEIVGWARDRAWPDDEPDPFDAQTASLKEMVEGLELTRKATLAYIDSLSDAELEEILHQPQPYWEALRLADCPRSEMLRNIAAHEWYHTGQLISYLWSRGEDPNTWA